MRMAEISRSTRDPQISVADRPEGRVLWLDAKPTETCVSDASHRLEPIQTARDLRARRSRQRASSPGARANRVVSNE